MGATAVKLKYSRKGGLYHKIEVSSEQLIEIARDLHFYEMYEYMCFWFEQKKKEIEDEQLQKEMLNQGYKEKFRRGQVISFVDPTTGTMETGELLSLRQFEGTVKLQISLGKRREWIEPRAATIVQEVSKKNRGWFMS